MSAISVPSTSVNPSTPVDMNVPASAVDRSGAAVVAGVAGAGGAGVVAADDVGSVLAWADETADVSSLESEVESLESEDESPHAVRAMAPTATSARTRRGLMAVRR